MNSLPEAPLKLKDQTTMKETMKANLESAVPSGDLPPATAKSDRELLELAAKAAGIKAYSLEGSPSLWVNTSPAHVHSWNPLTDDGDALRLAVKLSVKHGIAIEIKRDEASGNADAEAPDAFAATRLAILRAAAAIGEMNSSPLLPPKKG